MDIVPRRGLLTNPNPDPNPNRRAYLSVRGLAAPSTPACLSSRGVTTFLIWQGRAGHPGVLVLSGGHFDGALCVASEVGRTLHVSVGHSRTITCVTASSAGTLLLTGAADTSVVLWSRPHSSTTPEPVRTLATPSPHLRHALAAPSPRPRRTLAAPSPHPRRTLTSTGPQRNHRHNVTAPSLRQVRALRGHVRELTAVALSAEMGVAASGAADGAVLLHAARRDRDSHSISAIFDLRRRALFSQVHTGCLIRSIHHPDAPCAIGHLGLSALHGRVILGAADPSVATLHAFTLSGVPSFKVELHGGVRCVLRPPYAVSGNGTHANPVSRPPFGVTTFLIWQVRAGHARRRAARGGGSPG